MHKKWMLYGATGYTGRLIIEEAVKRGLTPVLAGRNEQLLKDLAKKYNLQYRCFDLSKRAVIAEQLKDIVIVLHCAGPFSATANTMMAACLFSKTHYLDITGEIEVFRHGKQLSKSAEKAGIVICPGVGFDVIPTDCLAATLKNEMPDATSLWLGFSSRSSFSPGTAKTSVEGLKDGGKIRRGGEILNVSLASKVRKIDFGDGLKVATTIPWGDIATAFYTTEIPDIEVYIPMSPRKIKQLKRLEKIRPVLGWNWVQNLLKKRVEKNVKGPEKEQRNKNKTYVWGEVINNKGDVKTARLITANGYDLTVTGSLGVVEFLLKNEQVPPGYKTPSQLMGENFVCQLPGSSEITLS